MTHVRDNPTNQTPIPYVDIAGQFRREREALMPIIEEVLESGQYVGGTREQSLEAALAEWCGTEHVVALNSGTDALILALAGLGIGEGDEVITPPNSFVASTAVIDQVGATPIFADHSGALRGLPVYPDTRRYWKADNEILWGSCVERRGINKGQRTHSTATQMPPFMPSRNGR